MCRDWICVLSASRIRARLPCTAPIYGLRVLRLGLKIRVHRFDPGTRLHKILYIARENNILKQDIVYYFLYTTRTQNIGVDLFFLTLVHNKRRLGKMNCELRRRSDTNSQEAQAG